MMPTPRGGGSGSGRGRRRQRQFAALRPVPAAVQLEAASSLLNRAPLFVAGAVVLVWRVVLGGLALQGPLHHLLDLRLLQDRLRRSALQGKHPAVPQWAGAVRVASRTAAQQV